MDVTWRAAVTSFPIRRGRAAFATDRAEAEFEHRAVVPFQHLAEADDEAADGRLGAVVELVGEADTAAGDGRVADPPQVPRRGQPGGASRDVRREDLDSLDRHDVAPALARRPMV